MHFLNFSNRFLAGRGLPGRGGHSTLLGKPTIQILIFRPVLPTKVNILNVTATYHSKIGPLEARASEKNVQDTT